MKRLLQEPEEVQGACLHAVPWGCTEAPTCARIPRFCYFLKNQGGVVFHKMRRRDTTEPHGVVSAFCLAFTSAELIDSLRETGTHHQIPQERDTKSECELGVEDAQNWWRLREGLVCSHKISV